MKFLRAVFTMLKWAYFAACLVTFMVTTFSFSDDSPVRSLQFFSGIMLVSWFTVRRFDRLEFYMKAHFERVDFGHRMHEERLAKLDAKKP